MNAKNIAHDTGLAEVSKAQLIQDFKVVIADAEALLQATAGEGGEALAAVRHKIEASLADAKDKMIDAQAALLARSKAAARATDEYVHVHPWQAMGVAASLGVVVGLLIGRR